MADGSFIAARVRDVAAGLDRIPQSIAGMPQMTLATRATQGKGCPNAAAAGYFSYQSHTGAC